MAGALTLTEMARGAGCGCKLAPGLLAGALAALPALPPDARILVGHDGLDDAAAYRVSDDLAVVASVDFFTPVVDDPEAFGAIAAVNALSDLHAMGATPTLALALVAFPKEADPDVLARIVRGGAEAALAEGCPVLGGHSIDDPEPKYGLAVVGTARPDRLLRNDAGRPGDALVLTKALGVGIAVTASRAGAPVADLMRVAVRQMRTSNGPASRAARDAGVVCATDVTGFGLGGHLRSLAAASGVGARVEAAALPLLPGVSDLAAAGFLPGGARRNRDHVASWLDVEDGVPDEALWLMTDPQTSGGLLLAVAPDGLGRLGGALDAGLVPWDVVGELTDGPAGRIAVGA